MRRDIGKFCVSENFAPLSRKRSEWSFGLPPMKNERRCRIFPTTLQGLENGEANRPNRGTFLAFRQPKAASFEVNFGPAQLRHLAPAVSGQREQSDNRRGSFVFFFRTSIFEDCSK